MALLVAAPGPDWAFTLSVVARGRSLAAAVAGPVSGYLMLTLAVATGVGILVARSPALLTALTMLGAGYLFWLRWQSLRTPATPHLIDGHDTAAAAPASRRSRLLVNIGVNGLNPMALLIFVALLPQFADSTTGWPLSLQLIALGDSSSPPSSVRSIPRSEPWHAPSLRDQRCGHVACPRCRCTHDRPRGGPPLGALAPLKDPSWRSGSLAAPHASPP